MKTPHLASRPRRRLITGSADGAVSQPGAPQNLPVPPTARPMGRVVF